MSREQQAREYKQSGINCSNSIYRVFKDDYKLSGNVPAPRSIEGKCGALLMTIQILKDLGKEQYIDDYQKEFIDRFGSDKCIDLMRKDRKCNDYVGWSTNYIEEVIYENR